MGTRTTSLITFTTCGARRSLATPEATATSDNKTATTRYAMYMSALFYFGSNQRKDIRDLIAL
ncbi:MAG: hypothetical protein ACRENG_14390 [bacterium]